MEIIRQIDTNELMCKCSWVISSCDLTDLTSEKAIEILKNKFDEILENFPILKVRLTDESNNQFFCYCKKEELVFDKLIKVVNTIEEYEELKEYDDLNSLPHWRIKIIEKPNNKIGIKCIVCHTICDGRSIFEFLELFCIYIKGEQLPDIYKNNIKIKNPLNSADRRECFTKTIKKNEIQYISSWSKLRKEKTFDTKIDLENDELINFEMEFEWEPVKKFMIKNNCSLQGIISASQMWAFDKYNHSNLKNKPVAIYTPVDTRFLKYSTKEYKNHLFGNNYSVLFITCSYKDDKLTQILECQKKLRESLATDEALEYNMLLKDITIEEMCKRQEENRFPSNRDYNVITASHLGRVPDRENIKFNFYYPLKAWGYLPNWYAYHNAKKLKFLLLSTKNIDKFFIDCIKETTLEYIQWITENNK